MATSDDLLTYCPGLFFAADRDGVLLLLSEGLARLLGPAVRSGIRLMEAVHPDDRHAFDASWAKLDGDAAPVPFELRLKGADGGYRRVSCSARRSATGEGYGLFQEIAPQAERIEAEARILHLIQDNIPICVWMVDRQGIFSHHAGKGLTTVGITPGQFLGKSIFAIYGDSEEAVGELKRALAGEIGHGFTVSDGNSWENWCIPVRDAEGTVTGAAGITLDLSEARHAQKELEVQIELIKRQQAVINALSTPIIEVWDKVLTLPLMGIVDSTRAAAVMENLLKEVSRKGARFALLDLTGVDAVDTSTANHILKLVQALRLLGAEGVITGIQPNVAQTMITLGVSLEEVVTCANLRDGLRYCITRMRADARMPSPSTPASQQARLVT
jgi:rsbT co-antagonist protein RsbR